MLKRRKLGRAGFDKISVDIEQDLIKHSEVKYVFGENTGIYLLSSSADQDEAIEDHDSLIQRKLLIYCYGVRGEAQRKKKLPITIPYEVFFDYDVWYDPFERSPPMRILFNHDLKKRNDWDDMPKIYQSDTTAKYFNARPKQVLEVNHGESYLIVIKDI